jgi:hypothetical protein
MNNNNKSLLFTPKLSHINHYYNSSSNIIDKSNSNYQSSRNRDLSMPSI